MVQVLKLCMVARFAQINLGVNNRCVIWRLLFLQRLSHIASELSASGAMTESQELFPAGGPGCFFFEALFLG